jgi:hypothetical protein
MKYIKYFKENLDIIKKVVNKNTKKIGIIYKNYFTLFDINFLCEFTEVKTEEIYYFERTYGNVEDGELYDDELNLNISQVKSLLTTINDISIDFLKNKKPDVFLTNYKDMNNEIYTDFTNKINKRAKFNFNLLKNSIPSDYIITYWFNNFFQNDESKSSTCCIIHKKDKDITALTQLRTKIII